jgi:hypothetical protein
VASQQRGILCGIPGCESLAGDQELKLAAHALIVAKNSPP